MKSFLGLFGAFVVGLCVGMTSMTFCPYLSKLVCQQCCKTDCCKQKECCPQQQCCPPLPQHVRCDGKCCCEKAGKTCSCCPGCVKGKDCTCGDKCTCCPCCKGHKTNAAPKKN